MSTFLSWLGGLVLRFVSYFGALAVLTAELFYSLFRSRIRWAEVGRQLVSIGFGSQIQVVVTGAATGAVFAAQVYYKFNQLGLDSLVGGIVALAMCRELGPVLTALMLAGRIGATMAAEIGTMKVTEQIDALRSLGVHPVDYLVAPRFIAMLFSVPLLIGESIRFGIGAARLMAVGVYNVPEAFYNDQLYKHVDHIDVIFGMTKGLAYGYIIVIMACHQGLTVRQGAVGVGRGTTAAVFYTSMAILIANFFLSLLLNYIWPIAAT